MERWRTMAERQHGVVGRAQLLEGGVNDDAIWHFIKKGVLEEILPGVYRVAGTARTWYQALAAACLWGGAGAVASRRSAAVLWELDGFAPGPVEISTVKQNRPRLPLKAHRTLVDPALTTRKEGIPVTNAHRTMRDLSVVLPPARADRVIDDALRRGLVSAESLRKFVEREAGSGNRGVGALRRLIDGRDPGYRPSASDLQARVRDMLVEAGLTGFVEESDVLDEEGVFLARPDFQFVQEKVIVEADSRTHHLGKIDFMNDLARRNRLTAAGWLMFHVTWHDVIHRRAERVVEIRKGLAHRAGYPRVMPETAG